MSYNPNNPNGQATMANSEAVVIASDQSIIPIGISAANFLFSTNNSSTSQLAANSTFTGVIETALNQPDISILMTSDQQITLNVYQYIDISGVYAVPTMTFIIPANTQFSRSVPINGNYVKVTATNNGVSSTTTFNLNVAYGTIGSADNQGNTKAFCQ